MAIAFVAAGTRLKTDVAASGSPQSIGLPAGHISGHWLLLVSVTEDNTGPSTPSGWSSLGSFAAGTSTSSPYAGRPHLHLFHRIDNGSLGSSVSVSFSTSAWPAGDPYLLAWTEAYSGADTSGPVQVVLADTTLSTAGAHLHPIASVSVNNSWLLSIRAIGADVSSTFTISGGTNTERVDDTGSLPAFPSAAAYDAGPLSTGAQTQRTTTASGTAHYGSVAVSLVLKPAAVAGSASASPTEAQGTATAYDATVLTTSGPWDLCAEDAPAYSAMIDWDNQGGPDVETINSITGEISIAYGRDQDRQLNPAAVGSAAFTVINVDRLFSPENVASPLYGDLEPAREVKIETSWSGDLYPLFRGRIDNYDLKADFGDRKVSFTFLDGLSLLQGIQLSTAVYPSMRTGALVDTILDLTGWTGPRDIDLGATVVKFWWAEGTDALTAIQDLVKSEGPPSVAYQAPDGTFVFRDRHHRLLRTESLTSQGTFSARRIDCGNVPGQDYYYAGAVATADGVAAGFNYLVADDTDAADILVGQTGRLFASGGLPKEDTVFTVTAKQSAFGFTNIFFVPDAAIGTTTGDELRMGNFDVPGHHFTKPFVYAHGWRDITNKVSFEVSERAASPVLTAVWTSEDTITLDTGQSRELQISTSDPFTDAVTPVSGTDFQLTGAGTVNVVLDRTSGQAAKISILAVGSPVTLTGFQLRARSISVQRTLKIEREDSGSISLHGERSYPDSAPWANANDADAIAGMILLHYSQRRPTVQLRITTEDPGHFLQVLQRTVSDRIRIVNGEIGLDDDFFVERVTHTINRMNVAGKPPVHSVVLGCEKQLRLVTNPFTFDKRGAGFDDGVFDPVQADNASTVFIFDDPIQGQFDVGLFGT
jgi:hypothetical protein